MQRMRVVLWAGQVLEELCAASIVAVKRCVQACGGVEMERLLRSLDDGFVEYFEAGASAIEQCRPDDPAIAYNLLALTDKCKTQFDVANAAVRKELLALRTQLHPSSTDTSTAILRRVGKLYCALDGRRSARLAAMLGGCLTSNHHLSGCLFLVFFFVCSCPATQCVSLLMPGE